MINLVFVFITDSYTFHYTGYVILAVGLLASNMVCKLIICTVTRKDMNHIQREVAVAIIFPLLIKFAPALFLKKILVVIFLGVSVVYAAVFSVQTVNKIAKILGIKVLTV